MRTLKTLVVVLTLLFTCNKNVACSMYKVTKNGKTMIGCNHDTWIETPRIWFETNGYGAAFTGARFDGSNGYAPQSGMNEFGLTFTRLSSATPKNTADFSKRKQITNATLYLKDILHTCKTVDDVLKYVNQYDHSLFSNDVFIYIEKSGKYVIVEPYKTIVGNDAKYVLANFCPSEIKDFKKIKQERYNNGSIFLKNKLEVNIDFCTSLSDTMHVCRDKIGDGTLLTSIWDNKEGNVYIYFYHNYKSRVTFNLKTELQKGDHILDITELFPNNKEFQDLKDFKTPLNYKPIDYFLRFTLVFFLFTAFYFLISYFRKPKDTFSKIKLLLFPLSLFLLFYMFVLAREINVYFFPAPYNDGTFSLATITSFLPYLLLLIIIPILILNKNILKQSTWSVFSKFLFSLNSFVYLILIVLFSYWKFYNIF